MAHVLLTIGSQYWPHLLWLRPFGNQVLFVLSQKGMGFLIRVHGEWRMPSQLRRHRHLGTQVVQNNPSTIQMQDLRRCLLEHSGLVPPLFFIPCPLQGAQPYFGSFLFALLKTLHPLRSMDVLLPPSFNHIQCPWSIFLSLCSISTSHSSSVPALVFWEAPENVPKFCHSSLPTASFYRDPLSIWIDSLEI